MTTSGPERPPGAIPEQTINRNWTELIQELRSTQTGVQVLTGFLLAVPFTDQFDGSTTSSGRRTSWSSPAQSAPAWP